MWGLKEEPRFPWRVNARKGGRRCDQHSAVRRGGWVGNSKYPADYSTAGGGSSLRPITRQTTLQSSHTHCTPSHRVMCGLALRANLSNFFKLECYVSQNVLWFSCPLLPGSVTLLFYSSSTVRIPLLTHPQFILWLAVIHVSLSATVRAGRYILDTSKISKAHHSAWHTAGAG